MQRSQAKYYNYNHYCWCSLDYVKFEIIQNIENIFFFSIQIKMKKKILKKLK